MKTEQGPSKAKYNITKENAKEMGKRGGKKITRKKRLSNSLRSRKYCKPDCPLFPCPLQPITMRPEFGGICALKEADPTVQAIIQNLFLKGREGAIREYTANICELAIMSKKAKSMRQKAVFSDKMNRFIETTYGKIMKQEVSGDTRIEVTWKEPKRTKK